MHEVCSADVFEVGIGGFCLVDFPHLLFCHARWQQLDGGRLISWNSTRK